MAKLRDPNYLVNLKKRKPPRKKFNSRPKTEKHKVQRFLWFTRYSPLDGENKSMNIIGIILFLIVISIAIFYYYYVL